MLLFSHSQSMDSIIQFVIHLFKLLCILQILIQSLLLSTRRNFSKTKLALKRLSEKF